MRFEGDFLLRDLQFLHPTAHFQLNPYHTSHSQHQMTSIS